MPQSAKKAKVVSSSKASPVTRSAKKAKAEACTVSTSKASPVTRSATKAKVDVGTASTSKASSMTQKSNKAKVPTAKAKTSNSTKDLKSEENKAIKGSNKEALEEFIKVLKVAKRVRMEYWDFKDRLKSDQFYGNMLKNEIISYNPLPMKSFPNPVETLFRSKPTVAIIQEPVMMYLMSPKENEGKTLMVQGPPGSGKTYGVIYDALQRRRWDSNHIVLIPNPIYLVENPKAIFNELIYAFANKEVPDDDVTNENFTSHSMNLIRQTYEECSQNDFKDCIGPLKSLMPKLAKKCLEMYRNFILYFEEFNALWSPEESRPMALFLRHDFPAFFPQAMTFTSTNILPSLGDAAPYYVLQKARSPNDPAIFIISYSK